MGSEEELCHNCEGEGVIERMVAFREALEASQHDGSAAA